MVFFYFRVRLLKLMRKEFNRLDWYSLDCENLGYVHTLPFWVESPVSDCVVLDNHISFPHPCSAEEYYICEKGIISVNPNHE